MQRGSEESGHWRESRRSEIAMGNGAVMVRNVPP